MEKLFKNKILLSKLKVLSHYRPVDNWIVANQHPTAATAVNR
jgi:hypothetical protein